MGARERNSCGSWKARTTLLLCIGTLNFTLGRNLFGVPPSGGPDRLKPGLRRAVHGERILLRLYSIYVAHTSLRRHSGNFPGDGCRLVVPLALGSAVAVARGVRACPRGGEKPVFWRPGGGR